MSLFNLLPPIRSRLGQQERAELKQRLMLWREELANKLNRRCSHILPEHEVLFPYFVGPIVVSLTVISVEPVWVMERWKETEVNLATMVALGASGSI